MESRTNLLKSIRRVTFDICTCFYQLELRQTQCLSRLPPFWGSEVSGGSLTFHSVRFPQSVDISCPLVYLLPYRKHRRIPKPYTYTGILKLKNIPRFFAISCCWIFLSIKNMNKGLFGHVETLCFYWTTFDQILPTSFKLKLRDDKT